MPHTARRTDSPARRAAAGALLVVVLAAVGACSSSSPARLDPTATSDALVDAVPTPTEDLLDEPQDPYSTVGALVDDFPTDLVPLPPDADILVSSARPAATDGLVEISLNLRTTLSADEVVEDLTAALTGHGFTLAPPPSPPDGLAASLTLTRGAGELVTVGVLDRDGVRTVTVGGTVDPAVA